MADIDIGAAAIIRTGALYVADRTTVEGSNPANDTGMIDTVETYFHTGQPGANAEVATFIHEGSNALTTRDSEYIGTVPAGSKQTFSGLDIDVATGDYFGIYSSAGYIRYDVSGGTGIWGLGGDWIPCTSKVLGWSASQIMSLYGTGETAAPPGPSAKPYIPHCGNRIRRMEFFQTLEM